MPRGQPDYGQYAVKEVSASVSDMGEVAARLGSIVTYDKRGDVVDFDNFEEPVLKWQLGFWGGGFDAVLDVSTAKSGSQSVLFSAPAVIFSGSHIHRIFPILGARRIGSEFSFCRAAPAFLLYHQFTYYTGTKLYQGYTVINLATAEVSVSDGTGAEVVIATFDSFLDSAFLYYTTKMVIDIETGKWVRMMLGHTEYDISAISLQVSDDPLAPFFLVRIGCETIAAAGDTMNVDDFVLTQAEP